MNRYEELNNRVLNWAKDKGILEKATPLAQIEKTEEEVAEIKECLFAQNNNLENFIDAKGRTANTKDSLKYELAGALVTLIIQSELQNLNILDCLELEINKLEKRTGKMYGGVFIKD